jgi:hypothetical protein
VACAAAQGGERTERRDRLFGELARLQLEMPLARTKQAYAILDLEEKRIQFRVRGRTMKEYGIVRYRLERPSGSGSRSSAFDVAHRLEDRVGKEIPASLPAGESLMIAPEPPPRYLWRFDGGLSVYIRRDAEPSAAGDRLAERVVRVAKGIGRLWRRLTGRQSRETLLYLIMEEEQSREAYRSLLPGQSLLLLPPRPGPSPSPAD